MKHIENMGYKIIILILVVLIVIGAIFAAVYVNKNNNQQQSSSSQTSSVESKPVKTIDTTPGSLLMLVNKENELESSWKPNLVELDKSYYYSPSKDTSFDERAADSLKAFIDDGRDAGFKDLVILSGFRTYSYQKANFDRHVQEFEDDGKTHDEAVEETAKIVARAGTSEHETGLAADIISSEWYNKNGSLTADFDKTDACKWLTSNCAKYGFILRYPEDKVDETGYSYESWHFRYVGEEVAKTITEKGISFEEYVKNPE